MRSEEMITVQLTREQADEVKLACIGRRNKLDYEWQGLLTREGPEGSIYTIKRSIDNLHRAERTIKEAIGNG